jgi:glycosyltransferase involved in cell wall biosynthesis
MVKPTLLFITPRLPAIADSGGAQVTRERLIELSQHFDTTILSLGADPASVALFHQLHPHIKVHQQGALRQRSVANWLKSLGAHLPLSVWRNRCPDFMAACSQLAHTSFDLLYVDHWLVWPAAEHFHQAKRKVLHLHNAEHLLFERAAVQSSGPRRWVLHIEARRTRKYLASIAKQTHEIHCLSGDDEIELKTVCQPSTVFHTFLPSTDITPQRDGTFCKQLLFVGTMTWEPNAEGIRWFATHVAPLLPDTYQTHVIGGLLKPDQPPEHQPGAGPLKWLGKVPSIAPYYANASVFIAPLLSGSGIKIKVLNALSHGLPVVTTSIGAEGFPDKGGAAVQVADTPEDFAKAIRSLCEHEDRWQAAASAAQPYIQSHFSSMPFSLWSANTAASLQTR